jgi:hypothetical protein
VYSAIIDDEPTTFGTTGFLYRSNKLMYDRLTRSVWNQFTGVPVIGPLAEDGARLSFFPVLLTTWQEWVEEHPDTTVLSAVRLHLHPIGLRLSSGRGRFGLVRRL